MLSSPAVQIRQEHGPGHYGPSAAALPSTAVADRSHYTIY